MSVLAQERVAIRNVTVVDTESGRTIPRMTVQIEGERIASITKGQGAATPRDAFDGTGLYVIPGLWDMHVHAFWTPLNPDRMFPLFLANGVTGIRDLGSPLDFEQLRVLRAKFDNAPLAPRIVMAGKLVDGDPPIWPGSLIAAKAEQAETAVRALRDAGADVVKLYSRLSRDGYIAVIHASQAAGLPTVGHVPISISAWDAAREGQHSIEHLSELLLACSFEEATLRQELLDAPPGKARDAIRRTQVRKLVETFDQKKAAALSEEFRKRAVWQVPTLLAQRAYAYPPSKGFSAEPWARYVTPETLAGYTKRLESFRQGKTPKELEWQERSYDREIELVRTMAAAGVGFLVGTDADLFHASGFGVHREMELLAEAGLGAAGALKAATLNPARSLQRTKDFGTVEAGKMADLVLLGGNPVADIRNSRRIRAVVLKGHLYTRERLNKILESHSQGC